MGMLVLSMEDDMTKRANRMWDEMMCVPSILVPGDREERATLLPPPPHSIIPSREIPRDYIQLEAEAVAKMARRERRITRRYAGSTVRPGESK